MSEMEKKRPDLVRSLRRSRLALVGCIILAVIVLVALAAPLLAPYNPELVDIRNRLKPPAWLDGGMPAYFLGTDNVGRDIASRIIYGARVSLFVGLATVLIGGLFGVGLGVVAGYFRGRLETAIMRLVDIQLAFPSILLAVAIMAAITCTWGNLSAFRQTNLKRLLAFSSIAHAGYMLMAVAIIWRPAGGLN